MINDETHISVCGIGPGNPDLIPNAVFKQVDKAEVLMGGKRQLAIFSDRDKTTCVFDGRTANLKSDIERHAGKHIVILVSGDTGFYSLRRFLLATFPDERITLTPGISSFQYFYARLGLGYENAFFASVHGKDKDYISKLDVYSSVFLLTDRKNNYKAIARHLTDHGYGHLIMHIGCNLSYNDEQILTMRASEALSLNQDFSLCSVIIENQEIS
ncbi:MAG: precorrin-6y C5,15-methyltransferase (decarboxylating) subunit CbiE [Bacteroidales bacterium]|nr:precorrin-6y C5,15-methyltransferase (decarboxylating) subunit CbiE [Bacteroidales bacterium]